VIYLGPGCKFFEALFVKSNAMKWQNITLKDLENLVNKISLVRSPTKRAPHPVYWYYLDGKKALRITMPNIHGGSGSITPGFLKQIRNNLKLATRDFEDLIECPLNAKEYEAIVRDKIEIWKRR